MHTEHKVIDMPQKCSEESEHICKDLSCQDNTFCRAEQPCHVHPLNGAGPAMRNFTHHRLPMLSLPSAQPANHRD